MKNHTLREIAKFGSGLVAGDLLGIIWVKSSGLLPLTIIGLTVNDQSLTPALIFDIALLALLVYYGWHLKSPVHSPSERTLLTVAGIIFLAVAVAHFLRLMFGWDVILGDFAVPLWLSWVGVAIAAYLSYASFHFAVRMRGAKAR